MTTLQLAIPYLESGDQLMRAEFEQRYNAMPDGFKAELDRRNCLRGLTRSLCNA
jgi:hypothetical protein